MDEEYHIRALLDSLKKQQQSVTKMARAGKITYMEAGKRAAKMGETTGKLVLEHLAKLYPEGSVGRDEALRVIQPALKSAHDYAARLAGVAQSEVNREAGVGLKPLLPEFDKKRVALLAEELAQVEDLAMSDGGFVQGVKQFMLQSIDDAIRMNAEAHERAGMQVRITRMYDGIGVHNRKEPCEWCLDRVMSQVTLEEAYDRGAFERHPGCGCPVIYTSARGETTVRGRGGQWTAWR